MMAYLDVKRSQTPGTLHQSVQILELGALAFPGPPYPRHTASPDKTLA